jgi:hypothetical protein
VELHVVKHALRLVLFQSGDCLADLLQERLELPGFALLDGSKASAIRHERDPERQAQGWTVPLLPEVLTVTNIFSCPQLSGGGIQRGAHAQVAHCSAKGVDRGALGRGAAAASGGSAARHWARA